MTKEQWIKMKDEESKDILAEGYHRFKNYSPNQKAKKSAKQELADAVLRNIQENYMKEFSLSALADTLHINKFHMLRTFKAMTGETPLQYHNRYRCEKARELLQQPELPVSYIAFETGFNSASHFSRVFKAVTQETPTEYRKAYLSSLSS